MTTNPVYPKSILPWSDRVDDVDVVRANDPNSLAADVIAIEDTLGVMPQQMKAPMLGNPVNFVNVDQRLDYLSSGQNIPIAQLYNTTGMQVAGAQGPGTNYGMYNSYQVAQDPFAAAGQPMYNGSDITMPVTAWCSIDSNQFWEWWSNGYSGMGLYVGGNLVDYDKWDWGFPGNYPGGLWRLHNPVRPACTHVHWEGVVNQGDRIRVVSENGANFPDNSRAYQMNLSVTILRTTPWDYHQVPFNPTVQVPGPAQVSQYAPPPNMSAAVTAGQIVASWDMFPLNYPQPSNYNVAVYGLGSTAPLVYYTTVPTPATFGRMSWTVTPLPTGVSYRVVVWASGGIAPPRTATLYIGT